MASPRCQLFQSLRCISCSIPDLGDIDNIIVKQMTRFRQSYNLLLSTKILIMVEQLTLDISQYGYLSIFLLVFLQEVGVPNPIPNELVLLFSGYLSLTGVLNLPLVILSAIVGDLLGGGILFIAFYFFGNRIIKRMPKWIPLSKTKLERISERIRVSGHYGIFIGRLTPFIKGYVSVLCGVMRVVPSKFGIILLSTSIIWSSAYVICGYFAGPYWELIMRNSSTIQYQVLLIAVSVIVIVILLQVLKRLLSTTK